MYAMPAHRSATPPLPHCGASRRFAPPPLGILSPTLLSCRSRFATSVRSLMKALIDSRATSFFVCANTCHYDCGLLRRVAHPLRPRHNLLGLAKFSDFHGLLMSCRPLRCLDSCVSPFVAIDLSCERLYRYVTSFISPWTPF